MGQAVLGLLPFTVVTSECERFVEFDRRLAGDGLLDRPVLQPGIAPAFLPMPFALRGGLPLEAKAHAVLGFAPDVGGCR